MQKETQDQIKNTRTETPKGSSKLLSKPVSLEEVLEKTEKAFPGSKEIVQIAIAVNISARMSLPVPIWLIIVGVPSSVKTEVVRLLMHSPVSYYLDTMTLNPFISGQGKTKENEPHDLLPELNEKCFICKDWTSIFSLNEETTKKLLGEFVSIYDGDFSKYSALRGKISYQSRFSHIGCVTPAALNRHHNYMNIVGPRFLFYLVPTLDEEKEKKVFEVIWEDNNRTAIIEEAKIYASSYCNQRLEKLSSLKLEVEDDKVKSYLSKLAKFIARARGIVIPKAYTFQDESDKTRTYYEPVDLQTEEPWRALLQIRSLARALALTRDKTKVGFLDLKIIRKVAISSMPADRAKAIRSFEENPQGLTSKKLGKILEVSQKTSRRLLEELHWLGVLEKERAADQQATLYYVAKEFDKVVNPSSEFLSPEPEWDEDTLYAKAIETFTEDLETDEEKEEE